MNGSIGLLIFPVTCGNFYLREPMKNEFIETAALLNFINRVCFVDYSEIRWNLEKQ
jgi:hypothetical protein